MALLNLSPVIESCRCRGRELVSNSISAIQAPMCQCGLYYTDDLLLHAPLESCSYIILGMWSSFSLGRIPKYGKFYLQLLNNKLINNSLIIRFIVQNKRRLHPEIQ